jgi:hypothetical protein
MKSKAKYKPDKVIGIFFLIGFLFGPVIPACGGNFRTDESSQTLIPISLPSVVINPSRTPTPRFMIITITVSNTPTIIPLVMADVTPSRAVSIEPTGCLMPEEDYSIVTVNGFSLNRRTYIMLEHAAEIYKGEIEITGHAITQGSFTSDISASFGTHQGGGAVDLSVMRKGTYSILHADIPVLVHALRIAGFAAWFRDLNELYSGSPAHIHAIAIGDKQLSPAAIEQLTGEAGYFSGFSGIPVINGNPTPDRFGGPILCQWMKDAGYQDLRTK